MEQLYSIPLSSVVATLLLNKEIVTAIDIVRFNSSISLGDVDVDIIDDDINCLFFCVDMDDNFNFKLKKNLNYDSVLENGDTVSSFLEKCAVDDKLINILLKNKDIDDNIVCNKSVHIAKVKRKFKIPCFFRKCVNNN